MNVYRATPPRTSRRSLAHSLARTFGGVLVLASMTAPIASPAMAVNDAVSNTLMGTVSVDSGGSISNARVIAVEMSSRRGANTDGSGNYTITGLLTGTYSVNIVPVTITTTSPTWVYTAGAQLVNFPSSPLTQTLNFTAAAATGVISGNVVAPDNTTNFGPGSRVWVRAANQEGQGNTVQVDPTTGAFSVNVLPGNTMLRMTFENPTWAPPQTLAGSVWFVDAGGVIQPQPVGMLKLSARTDTITGAILDEHGQPVASPLTVRAWRVDGSEVATTETISGTGAYALKVITGTWDIWAAPAASSAYVAVQFPQRVVFASENVTKTGVLRVATADVTVNGTYVDKNAATVTSLNVGRALPMRRDEIGRWQQLGPGTAIVNGAFSMKLAASSGGVYEIRSALPPIAGITALASPALTVVAGHTYTITIPTTPDNSTITGTFKTQTGSPAVNLPGIVYGASNRGDQQNARVNPLDAQYAMSVASTDTSGQGGSFWRLYGYVDPISGWVVERPVQQRVFLPYNNGNGATATADFTVARLNSAIIGTVKSAAGTPIAGAIVHVNQQTAAGLDAFHQWAITRADGTYRVRVPAGTYRVGASFDHLVQPVPQTSTAPADGSVTVNLLFRIKDATITGQVQYSSVGFPAFVRAYSKTGAHAQAFTGPAGNYELDVNSGDTWYVQAVAETQIVTNGVTSTLFLISPRVAVTTTTGANPGVNLTLLPRETLPEATAFRFDATDAQAITLEDNAQVLVPAGALAESGNVTLFARPISQLADDGNSRPVSFGYRLEAFDESGIPIEHFNAPVTLVVPFTAVQLTTLGVTPEQLVPEYWDQATSSWKPVPTVSVQVDANGNGTVNINVSHFTDFSLMATSSQTQVFVPIIAH